MCVADFMPHFFSIKQFQMLKIYVIRNIKHVEVQAQAYPSSFSFLSPFILSHSFFPTILQNVLKKSISFIGVMYKKNRRVNWISECYDNVR